MAKRSAPEINAGSMADIAFLLLIFFLVTTTIDKDKGLLRQMPPPLDENMPPPPIIKEKNLFIVNINGRNELLVENERMELKDLRKAAVAFIDNGGTPAGQEGHCDFCKGEHSPSSSDNPTKAIISMQSDRLTSTETFIAVQNELGAAYNEIRDRESMRLYGWKFTEKKAEIKSGDIKGRAKEKIEEKMDVIKDMIPFKLTETEPKKN